MVHNDFCHYDILGISKDASKKDIRVAYLRKTKEVIIANVVLLVTAVALWNNIYIIIPYFIQFIKIRLVGFQSILKKAFKG